MYITDARHFLDEKGAIAPRRGPAKAMADFHAGVIACATDFEAAGVVAPTCFKCKKAEVRIALAQDDAIIWSCTRCNAEGRISNWQGTLWDLSDRPDTSS
jgi:ribosomal protein L37AE/L43A